MATNDLQPFSQQSQISSRKGSKIPNGHILCSEKWRGNELIKHLQGGVRVLYEDNLGVVDFHPSDHMGVVYILEADIVATTLYKNKLVKLRMMNTVKGVVMGEHTHMSEQYWSDLQQFVVLELGLVLLPVTCPAEAARFLTELVHLENRPSGNQLRVKPKAVSKECHVMAAMQAVPGIGEVKVQALLQRFKCVMGICNATDEDLAAVVGKSSATSIRKFFSSPTNS